MRAYRGPAFNSASAYVRKFFNLKRLIDPGLCKPTSLLYSSRVISSSSSESLLLIVKCIDHTTKHGHQCKSVKALCCAKIFLEGARQPANVLCSIHFVRVIGGLLPMCYCCSIWGGSSSHSLIGVGARSCP
jgi:hypothetical protein